MLPNPCNIRKSLNSAFCAIIGYSAGITQLTSLITKHSPTNTLAIPLIDKLICDLSAAIPNAQTKPAELKFRPYSTLSVSDGMLLKNASAFINVQNDPKDIFGIYASLIDIDTQNISAFGKNIKEEEAKEINEAFAKAKDSNFKSFELDKISLKKFNSIPLLVNKPMLTIGTKEIDAMQKKEDIMAMAFKIVENANYQLFYTAGTARN